jgi:hypothetical protein
LPIHDHGDIENADWEWQFSFKTHWGVHSRSRSQRWIRRREFRILCLRSRAFTSGLQNTGFRVSFGKIYRF